MVAIPFLFFVATGAVAADMLPLRQGIYVRVGVPCKGASNADTLSYWGGNNGINDQQTACKIKSLKKDGSAYSIRRTCTSIRFGGSFDDQAKVTVISQTSFTLEESTSVEVSTQTFRLCGPKVQF